jgi:acyl dehydratase
MALNNPESIRAKIGHEVGVSDWVEVTQDMVNRFADLTDDHQFIHTDPAAAAATLFGGTIAHGFLVMALLAKLGKAADVGMQGAVMGVNYGFEKVRLLSPVRTGKRIRGRFVLQNMVERSQGQWLSTLAVTVEIEGEAKPAIVAEWLGLQFVRPSAA